MNCDKPLKNNGEQQITQKRLNTYENTLKLFESNEIPWDKRLKKISDSKTAEGILGKPRLAGWANKEHKGLKAHRRGP